MNLQKEYNLIKEGKGDKANFKRQVLFQCPNLVSPFNSFDDMVSILKNRNIISEAVYNDKAKYEKIIQDADRVNPYELKKGISYEMKSPNETWKMDGGGKFDIDPEDYYKAMDKAVKNLQKDPMYYTRLLSNEKVISNEKRPDTMKPVGEGKKQNFVNNLNKMTVYKKKKDE